jgi:hypothetical protein
VKVGLRSIGADDGGSLGLHYLVGGIIATITCLWPRCSKETKDLGLPNRMMASLLVSLYLLGHHLETRDA